MTQDEPRTVTLEELGVETDPGTIWHPRRDKAEARNPDGTLRDLDHAEVLAHIEKPEARGQVDSVRNGEPLSAEDSLESPGGVV
jgi:hypothetical protein